MGDLVLEKRFNELEKISIFHTLLPFFLHLSGSFDDKETYKNYC